jgi:hypothetical protein
MPGEMKSNEPKTLDYANPPGGPEWVIVIMVGLTIVVFTLASILLAMMYRIRFG